MTVSLTKMTHDDLVKLYDVEGYGVVSRGNAVFIQHCIDKYEVDSLEINKSGFIRFRSGMGISTLQVTRVS
jgi:hypothetical protein